MNKITLKCTKATVCENNNGQTATLLKLQGAGTVVKDAFGESSSRCTYYRFVEGDASNMLDKDGDVDLDLFDIVKREREFADKDTGEIIVRTLNYLYAKSS